MAVLVLGAAGGIGGALTRHLAAERVKLVVAGRAALALPPEEQDALARSAAVVRAAIDRLDSP